MSNNAEHSEVRCALISPLAWNTEIKTGVKEFLWGCGITGVKFARNGEFLLKGNNFLLFKSNHRKFPTPYTEQTSVSAIRKHTSTLLHEENRRRELEASMSKFRANCLESDLEECRRREAGKTAKLEVQCKSAVSYFAGE